VFGFGVGPCYVCETKVTIGLEVFWFSSDHKNGKRHLA
jgi:hypothetical protein